MPKKPNRQVGAWDFTLPTEDTLPELERGVFTLTPLSLSERMRVRDELERMNLDPSSGTTSFQSRAFQIALELVLDHLVSVRNVPSDAPEDWPGITADRAVKMAWLERNLSDLDVAILGTEIRNRSILGPAEKNS